MKSFNLILEEWKKYPHLRLGQFFVSRYIKDRPSDLTSWWRVLYYTSESMAKYVIKGWLVDNQYTETLPPRVDE